VSGCEGAMMELRRYDYGVCTDLMIETLEARISSMLSFFSKETSDSESDSTDGCYRITIGLNCLYLLLPYLYTTTYFNSLHPLTHPS
jgi:hypothetical protein